MDTIDRSILNELIKNCRITYQELAEKHEISANAIKKRVKKLEDSGFIDGYFVTLSPAMIDADILFGLVTTDGTQDEGEFVDLIGSNPHIRAAASYTHGCYALLAEYTNSNELLQIGAFLRGLVGSENVEIFSLIEDKGKKMELTKLHLQVLEPLLDNPRMSIVDVSKQTGLTARRVRRIVREMIDSQSIYFSTNYELGMITSIAFLVRLTYNEKKVDHKRVIEWLNQRYPLTMWEFYISDLDPTIFVLLSANTIPELDATTREIRSLEYVSSVRVMINQYHKVFPGLRQRRIREMIRESRNK